MGQNKEKKDQLKKKENLSLSREAYEVVHKAFFLGLWGWYERYFEQRG